MVKVRKPVKISENLTDEGKARLDQDLNVTLKNVKGSPKTENTVVIYSPLCCSNPKQ